MEKEEIIAMAVAAISEEINVKMERVRVVSFDEVTEKMEEKS